MLDDFAHTNEFRSVSPRLKLLVGIVSILVCVFSQHPLVPITVAVILSSATVLLAKIPARFYLGLLSIPLSFALFSGIVILFITGGGDVLAAVTVFSHTLAIHEGGAALTVLLLARTFGGMCSLFFIALTTPMVELFSIMRSCRFPQVFVDLSMLIYRFIFVLLDEAMMIRDAQVMRLGYGGFRNAVSSCSMLGGVLFLRALESGERLMVAMDSRCYDGRLEVLEEDAPRSWRAIAATAVYLGAIVIFAYMLRTIPFP